MHRELSDIDRYCAGIGYSGPREPTLAVLRSIVAWLRRRLPAADLVA